MKIQFLGAARHVTGSKHLLTINDARVLLDCGMMQGPRRIANKVNFNLRLPIKKLDAVILSHAHIDHCGSLPRLVKLGYEGPIYCTEATQDLCKILLADSAYLQASDAKYLQKKKGRSFEPAYGIDDVSRTLKLMMPQAYEQPFDVATGVKARFHEAGHIIGSAFTSLDIHDGRKPMRICYTGDHGRRGVPILRDPTPLPECDVLITESTYGDRLHPDLPDLELAVKEIIEEEQRDGGRILIPSFSVGRTQNILYFLGNLMAEGSMPKLPIYVDSPLSTKATKIVARHSELFDAEAVAAIDEGRRPFFFDGVRYVADAEESMTLNALREGIIISASGMCEGGRILHHLKQSLGRAEDCVVLVGFQAQGTLGRRLAEGAEYVKIFGERRRVVCKVRCMDGLSAHADYREMLDHYAHLTPRTNRVFVVHGEEKQAMQFADRLLDLGFRNVDVPVHKETFEL